MTEPSESEFTGLDRNVGYALCLYVFAVGLGAGLLVVANFPGDTAEGPFSLWPFREDVPRDRALLFLSILAGVSGSFIHAAQSLSGFLGNRTFRASWAPWYFMRPWIGGVLGLAIYVALRAGIVSASADVSAYGVIAFGLLGGWFSKTTTDKLQEVFETIFKTDADKNRKDKMEPSHDPRGRGAGLGPAAPEDSDDEGGADAAGARPVPAPKSLVGGGSPADKAASGASAKSQ